MEFVQQNMMWVALALVSGGMLVWPLVAGGGVERLTPAQATLLMNREDALVLDVRETGEWTSGHIPGARHITLAQLEKRMSEIEKFKDRPVIMDFVVDPEECVYPMVPAGAPISNMILL